MHHPVQQVLVNNPGIKKTYVIAVKSQKNIKKLSKTKTLKVKTMQVEYMLMNRVASDTDLARYLA